LLQILVGDVGGLIALGGDLAARAAMNSYSRDHEREADAAAVAMLHSAGIDPKEYATFFAVMDKLPGANSIPHWMSSHPGNQERIENIKKDVEKLGPVKLQPLGIDWSGILAKCGALPSRPQSATQGKSL
jgi:predicted Zn-dependent protease